MVRDPPLFIAKLDAGFHPCVFLVPVSIHSDTPLGDLSRLRIDRDAPARRRWLPWAAVVVIAGAVAAAYPSARVYLAERGAPEVEVARVAQLVVSPGGSSALPVLVASGYVVARHSSDVGVKIGGRIAVLRFEEGTRVRKGAVIAEIEHADIDAQLEAARRSVTEAEAALGQTLATRAEDVRTVERQRALAKDGITTDAQLTGAEAAAAVSGARVTSAQAAIASARARVRIAEETLENANVRAPFDGVVVKKRAELGETVSPYGVAGQGARDGGAIATVADLSELEVQTEVSENSVAKLIASMPAEVKLQAYPDQIYRGRLRQIFPSADRAKAIVEVRVTMLDADARVKPEMTASVTFQEPTRASAETTEASAAAAPAVMLVSRRAIVDSNGQSIVWAVNGSVAARRVVSLGAERLDQVEVRSGLVPGETVILNAPARLTDGARVRIKGT